MTSGALVTTANSSGPSLPRPAAFAIDWQPISVTAERPEDRETHPGTRTVFHVNSNHQALSAPALAPGLASGFSSASYNSAMTPKVIAASATLNTYQS